MRCVVGGGRKGKRGEGDVNVSCEEMIDEEVKGNIPMGILANFSHPSSFHGQKERVERGGKGKVIFVRYT